MSVVRASLITGVSGYVGGHLSATLLHKRRSLTQIWILRSTERETARQRAYRILRQSPFDACDPNSLSESQIYVIDADLTTPLYTWGCPIHVATGHVLDAFIVDTVYHCAASIDFELPLHQSCQINAFGTFQLIQYIHVATRSEPRFVHVSTAFVCPSSEIPNKEILLRLPPFFEDNMDRVRDWVERGCNATDLHVATGDQLQSFQSPESALGPFLNTYALSKCLTERLLQSYWIPDGKLCIIRPSIVAAAVTWPFPGWYRGHAAFIGYAEHVLLGHIPYMDVSIRQKMNMIPVDVLSRIIVMSVNRPDVIIHATAPSRSTLYASTILDILRDTYEMEYGRELPIEILRRTTNAKEVETFKTRRSEFLTRLQQQIRHAGDTRDLASIRRLRSVEIIATQFEPVLHKPYAWISAYEKSPIWDFSVETWIVDTVRVIMKRQRGQRRGDPCRHIRARL
jgi:nucleoside-diphosphate-sugar epimerase